MTRELGPRRLLADVDGAEIAAALEWGTVAVNTWNSRRAAVVSWLAWCRRRGDVAPEVPATTRAERPPTLPSKARSRTAIDRLISRRDVGIREKMLWRAPQRRRPGAHRPHSDAPREGHRDPPARERGARHSK